MAEGDDPVGALARVPEIDVADAGALGTQLYAAEGPFIVRGLVSDWPLVAAGRQSAKAARDYLLRHHRDRPFTVATGDAANEGRIFYDETMRMNFRSAQAKLPDIFAEIDGQEGRADARTIYLSSIDMKDYFVGLHEANQVNLGDRSPLASIWMGTPTRIAAHNDFPDNLACVAVGRRRFTLFPPDQFANLYLGPLDNTPAGRAVSMADIHAPDFDRFPRFRQALDHALVAELEPGDALHIPSSWWHHVEGLDPFNVLVNYWWRDTPRWLGQPQNALHHAILAIRDLPEDERRHWRDMFDHYVFGADENVTAHISEAARGILSPLTPESASRLRMYLLRTLNQ
ncbi:cupin-like domain-containing protein [Allosphingosinicella vermicomposti]|uniref:cupin-like domain-containing protein n=1 Tax=Allosphingosinicella vermicomposti TaxID=614671 RepID=UPI000D0F4844|nr:cupin-like domain-containing protein [Allosphingosinicella vermicomposti]